MAEIETVEDAIEEACDLLRVEMMKNKGLIVTATKIENDGHGGHTALSAQKIMGLLGNGEQDVGEPDVTFGGVLVSPFCRCRE